MKKLKQIGHIDWKRPKDIDEHDEIGIQLNLLSKHPKIERIPADVRKELEHLRDTDEYTKALEDAKVKKIKPENTKNILNHTSTPGSWKTLNPEKKKNVLSHFNEGKVHMPIILRNKETKQKWLMAGNTRLTYNSQVRKKKTPCLVIDYE